MVKPPNLLYTPIEIIALQSILKSTYDAWFGQTKRPDQSFTNFTLIELHKAGYKIVKFDDPRIDHSKET